MDFLSLDGRIREALAEDLGRGDLTTDAVIGGGEGGGRSVSARVLARQKLVLAGWPVFSRVFALLGPCSVRSAFHEGDEVQESETVGIVEAQAGVILKGERVALNFLQRLSGIASLTRTYVDLVAHTRATLLDTRKTTPLWRSLEKYAVRVGGGRNHRFGLDDGFLIKENHVALAGSVTEAVRACRSQRSHLHRIEVEVGSMEQVLEAIEAGADVLLLDNMSPEQVREAVAAVQGRCPVEVSGGINADNVVDFAEAGADFLSIGALTHSARAADLSLLLEIHE